MTLHIPFDNSYARLPAQLFTAQSPTPVAAPRLVAFNHALAQDLGFTGDFDDADLTAVFSGSTVPEGAQPLAQLYAGHQFGGWNPQLGDGRAVLLGESNGFDIQLKGSGPTAYSRRGDGRSWLGPVLREYLVSEAMHALGIPTTRALAAVETGEAVYRETALPGAILTRVASSHIRVGTFQAVAARRDIAGLQALYEHAVDRHYPESRSPTDFLNAVIAAQSRLIAHWMSVGFIHGVMNTDNCAISGETIDYGPCAFIDAYHPMTVFSSIDRQGRYAFGNQSGIIVWNMAQLATALVPLMPDQDLAVTEFTAAVHSMPAQIEANHQKLMRTKIGLTSQQPEDAALVQDLLDMMEQQGLDFTNTFRSLSDPSAATQFDDKATFTNWHDKWQRRLAHEDSSPDETMNAANPVLIPRNHRVEHMIQSALQGDYAPFNRLMQALSAPYADDRQYSDLTTPPIEAERVKQTFCGT
ncbi:protein adenylyltransferase SelO [Shimia sp.]|uniref:protein adenylyltransferase SelO n=1 Tax=Shimia sp. TaxID=1954381 RepID=UPI0032983CD1